MIIKHFKGLEGKEVKYQHGVGVDIQLEYYFKSTVISNEAKHLNEIIKKIEELNDHLGYGVGTATDMMEAIKRVILSHCEVEE